MRETINKTAAKRDFRITRGDTFEFSIDFELDGVAMDLTGTTLRGRILGGAEDVDLVQDAEIQTVGNVATVNLSNTITANLTRVRYRYDIQITLSTGVIYTVARGVFLMENQITE